MTAFCLGFSQTAQADSTENQSSDAMTALKSTETQYAIGNNQASDNTNTAVQTGTGTTTNNNSNNTGLWSTIGPFVNMILVLIAVIACIYGIVWLLKKSMRPGAENDPYLKKTASITLSPGKTVQVVTLQDKAYLLGVSDSSITLISEIEDKELIDAMNLNTPVGGKKPANFAALLASLTGSAKRTENFLRSKREKLNNGEGQ
jgi:flagellar protein FliO/FliZ